MSLSPLPRFFTTGVAGEATLDVVVVEVVLSPKPPVGETLRMKVMVLAGLDTGATVVTSALLEEDGAMIEDVGNRETTELELAEAVEVEPGGTTTEAVLREVDTDGGMRLLDELELLPEAEDSLTLLVLPDGTGLSAKVDVDAAMHVSKTSATPLMPWMANPQIPSHSSIPFLSNPLSPTYTSQAVSLTSTGGWYSRSTAWRNRSTACCTTTRRQISRNVRKTDGCGIAKQVLFSLGMEEIPRRPRFVDFVVVVQAVSHCREQEEGNSRPHG